MSGFITITVHSARRLISVDSNGASDPYVTISGGKKKWKSSIKYKTLEPVWDEFYQGPINDVPTTFEITLRDVDTFSFKKDFMGKASITVTEKEMAVPPFWLKLEDKSSKNSNKNKDFGEIRIAYVVTFNKETISSLISNPSQTLQRLQKNPSVSSSNIQNQPVKKDISIFKIMQSRKPQSLKEFLRNAKPKDVNIVDGDGQSPLHIACLDYVKRIPEYLTMLLEFEGIDVNIRNNSSNTPLHYFCQMWPDHRICESLLTKFVDCRADVNAKNGNGETPLFKAIGNSAVRGLMMKFLFNHGADPHIITETSGQSLLHWAAREGRVDLLDLILDYSTDVDIKDKFNKTPLDMVEQWRTSFENRRENYDIIQSKLIRVKELYKFLDENDLGELKFSLRTDEYYLDVLCEIGQEEILKFTQFKVGTRHKLAAAVKQYKSSMNTIHQPTRNNKIHRADEKMDTFLKELKSGNDSFLVIDQNQIEYQEMLGKGGAGTVWKGVLTHESQALPCAIKELNSESIQADQLDEFKKEFEILNNVRHVNVVRLIGLTVFPRLGMVMELCTHGSMMDVLKRKDFDFGWDRFFAMLTDTINGIDRLHSNIPQLLHRDLKTLNLLVTKNGNTIGNQLSVRVADFGLASKNTHSKSDVLKEMQGTPFYMPPEMTTGSKYSEYSDIYSLAIIIWEMSFRVINGQYSVPYAEYEEFSGPLGAFTLMMRVSTTNLRPTLPDKMPPALVKILEKSWDSEPTARYNIKTIATAISDLHKSYLQNKPLWEQCETIRIPGTAPEKSTSNSESDKSETPPSHLLKAGSREAKRREQELIDKREKTSRRENSKDREHDDYKTPKTGSAHKLDDKKGNNVVFERPKSGRDSFEQSANDKILGKTEQQPPHRPKTSVQDLVPLNSPKKKSTEKTHK